MIRELKRLPGLNFEESTNEKTWDDTARVTAKFIARHLSGGAEEWFYKIERAHRGRSTVIHCQFESWRHTELVRQKLKEKKVQLTIYLY